MRDIDVALFTRLNTDLGTAGTLGVLGCTGVFRLLAPQGSVEPYLIYHQQTSTDSHAFSGVDVRSMLYVVKAVDIGPSGLRAAQMSERVDALLIDKPLTLANWVNIRLRRETGIEYAETDAGRVYQHYGAIYRIDVRP